MSFSYRVVVQTPSGSAKATYDSTDKIVELNSFDVTGAGDCGEAQFTVVYDNVAIDARDIVTVETTTVPNPTTSDFVPMYAGIVVQAPNDKSDDQQTVRCVGLRQRLYEVPVTSFILLDGQNRTSFTGDVAKMVWEAVAALTLPAGITFSTGDAPVTGFQLGTRYPNRESLGALLDALALTVGEFIVPTGETYTYDSVTFNAGATVPAVTWGVNADGELFFRRSLTTAAVVDESDTDTDVVWDAVNAEEVVNSVDVVYGTAYDLRFVDRTYVFDSTTAKAVNQEFNPEPLPLIRTFELSGVTAANRASKRVLATDPLALMTQNTDIEASAGADWSNPTNVLDNSTSTYAEATATSGDLLIVGRDLLTLDGNTSEGIVLIRYETLNPLPFRYQYNNTFALTPVCDIIGELPPTETGVIALVGLLISTPRIFEEPYTPTTTGAFFFEATLGARIYTVQFFQPDVDASGTLSRKFAEGFFVEPRLNVSTVRVPGVQPFTNGISITPLVGSAVLGVVERVSYGITTGEGVRTTYHVDQAFSSREAAERVVLERLARRAVQAGGQA
jgi:hypothetical protein